MSRSRAGTVKLSASDNHEGKSSLHVSVVPITGCRVMRDLVLRSVRFVDLS